MICMEFCVQLASCSRSLGDEQPGGRWGYEQGAAALMALCRGKGEGGAGSPLLAEERGDSAAALEQLAVLLQDAPTVLRCASGPTQPCSVPTQPPRTS